MIALFLLALGVAVCLFGAWKVGLVLFCIYAVSCFFDGLFSEGLPK